MFLIKVVAKPDGMFDSKNSLNKKTAFYKVFEKNFSNKKTSQGNIFKTKCTSAGNHKRVF